MIDPSKIIRKADKEAARLAALADSVRAERDRRLTACDYRCMPDYPQSDSERAAWAQYRQALRDVPSQAGFPGEVEWPVEPGA